MFFLHTKPSSASYPIQSICPSVTGTSKDPQMEITPVHRLTSCSSGSLTTLLSRASHLLFPLPGVLFPDVLPWQAWSHSSVPNTNISVTWEFLPEHAILCKGDTQTPLSLLIALNYLQNTYHKLRVVLYLFSAASNYKVSFRRWQLSLLMAEQQHLELRLMHNRFSIHN